jgi:hypothetical protein
MEILENFQSVMSKRGTSDHFHASQWPETMGRWVHKYTDLIRPVKHALFSMRAPVTEHTLWEALAGTQSPAWAAAKSSLAIAEERLRDVLSPENRPLGAIGDALAGEEVRAAQAEHSEALAAYIATDEEHRQDTGMTGKFGHLLAWQATIEKSLDLSQNVLDITEKMKPEEPAPARGLGLSTLFRSSAARWFKKAPARVATATPEA